MVNRILKDLYQIKIPLPKNPLKVLNSYLIKGDNRNLLVDTGFNWPECKEALLKGAAELNVDWTQTDFFITHVHGDHSGLVYDLAGKDSKVYCSKTDADVLQQSMESAHWRAWNDMYIKHGYPRERVKDQGLTIRSYISGSDMNFTFVKDGTVIYIGGFQLICIATPGHSPGHMCLYEPNHKFLIAGDHILSSITSNISIWSGVTDSLADYLASLDKVDHLDIGLVLPGHRELIYDCHSRIAQLKQHHANRLNEVMQILQAGGMNAYEVASRMHWDLSYNSWDEVSDYQTWFATGEAIAHLDHLAALGIISKTEKGGKFVYNLIPDTLNRISV